MPFNFQEHLAIQTIERGGVIAYPTEAVWGLGCNPFDQRAVAKILQLKSRDPAKGLILVAASMEQFAPFLEELSKKQLKTLQKTWPGPVTWLVPHHDLVPWWVCGEFSTVALRVSAHPVIQSLCKKVGPIVSTSANPAGMDPAQDILQLRSYFGESLDAIIPGRLGDLSQPTEIRDLMTGSRIR